MAPLAELASCWPPALAKSASMVLCLRVEASVDEVFHTTWVDSTLSVTHHKSRGDTGLRETAWVATKAALDNCSWHEPGDPAKDQAPIATHRYRKVRFESAPSALASKPFENTEVIQCNIYSPGKQYVLEAVTSTTAPYGDKFTIYIRTILTAESRSRCTLYITHAVDWDPSMNFMLKPMVAKGMDVGLRGAFKTLRQMLQDYHSCIDITEQDWEQSRQAAQATNFMHTNIDELVEDEVVNGEVEAATAAASVAVPAQAAQPQAVSPAHPPNLLSFMSEQLVYKDQVALLADVVGAGMRSIADQGLVARVLSVVLTLSLVSACVTVFKAIQSLCLAGGPLLAPVCYPLTHIIDVPDSTIEVLTTLALVALINYGIMKMSELSVVYLNKVNGSAPQQPGQPHAAAATHGQSQLLPAQPSGGKLPSPTSAKAAAAPPTPVAAGAAAAAGVVAGVAVAAATAKGSGAPGGASSSAAAGKDQPPASTSASAAKPPAATKGAKPEASTAAAKNVKPPPAPVVVKSNSSSPLRGSKVPGSGRRPSGSEPQVLEMQCLSPTEERGRSAAAAGAGGAADAGASQKLQRVSTTGTGAGSAGAAASAASAVQKSNASAPGGPAGMLAGRTAGTSDDGHSATSPHGKTMESERSWLDSMTDTFRGAWSKSQEPFNVLHGISPEAVEYGLMVTTAEEGQPHAALAKSRSVTDIAATAAGAKSSLVPSSPPAADRADLTSASMPAMMMDTPGLEEEEPDVVEEEVFENERFQPFRLWGHTWPGHFLPSDRVAHWSDRKETPFGPAAMVFEQVAPKLPNDGWRWVEDKWSIDMEGFDVDAVDADGWYYALDFNYLRRHGAGFQVAGSGKCSTHHFVRRRRWVRVRARIGMDASSPVPIAQAFSKDAAPDDFDRGGASTQRLQLRTSSDDAGVRRALTVGTGTGGSGGGGHAREPSFSANGASSVSVPCSPTQAATEDALGGPGTAVPKLASSWSALQAPTSSLMDRLEGVSPPLAAPTQPASTNPAAAAALQGSAGTVASAVPQQAPKAAPGVSATPAPSTSATAGAAPNLDRTSNNSGRRNLSGDGGSVYSDRGSNSNGATAAMMAAAAAAATAAAATAQLPSATPTSTLPKAALVSHPSAGHSPTPASGSARPHVPPAGASSCTAGMPAPVPVRAAPPQGSRPATATAGQAKQASGFAAHAQAGQAPASIALNALSLLEDLQSTGSLAFMGDQAGEGEARSLEGWSGSDFAADFSFSKLSLARERLAEGDLAAEAQNAEDSVPSSDSRVRSSQEASLPGNQKTKAPEPQISSEEEVLHDPLGAENQ